ncbi:MAG: MarR family transcriptional regulator [Oscillospiraceae bacterium]|nr:MarR family transcriptional regulator [Oscillospiraceae bacterium]
MARTAKKIKTSPISLSVDITKLFDAQMKVEMLKNGIKVSYRQLLRSLSQKDGVTQLDLVRLSKLKAPTISTTLRNMEAEGLVRRETDKGDARATRVFITEKGREADKKMRNLNARIEKASLSGLNAAEGEQLTKLLGKMKENMEKTSGITVDYEENYEE